LELKVEKVCFEQFEDIVYNGVYSSCCWELIGCGAAVFGLLLGYLLCRGLVFIVDRT